EVGESSLWGVAWDRQGRLFISDQDGRVLVLPRRDQKPIEVARGFQSPKHLCIDATGKSILVVDDEAGTLTAITAQLPGEEVDASPMPVATQIAFPDLKWTGWKGMKDDGRVFQLRPVLLTHAGDGSNRVFVGIQQGIIHVFPNDEKANQTKVFLDIK